MTSTQKRGVASAILIIAIGVAWLLNVIGVVAGVNWVWTGSLGVMGALILGFGGVNQLTILVGPFLIVASILSILRQTGQMSIDVEVPVLVVCFGVLMLLSYILRLPLPEYMREQRDGDK
jgi:hypothetical protein